MQCIWRNIARNRVANLFSNNLSRNITTVSSPLVSTLPPPPPLPVSYPAQKWSFNTTSLPLSRVALAATKAVHISLKEHALEDAVHIVNSIRYASLPPGSKLDLSAWKTVEKSRIQFPKGLSPRLPVHALLHGLVRLGMLRQASLLATTVMKSGIRVHGKTLESIVNKLASTPTVKKAIGEASNARLSHYMHFLLRSPRILNINPSMVSDANTAFALKLVDAARQSRSHRKGAMFSTLITLCLINGEIIIASLLFGLLAKDWESRSQVLTRMSASLENESQSLSEKKEQGREAYRFHLLTNTLRPDPGMLKAILKPIEEVLENASRKSPEYQTAVQALANLASVLDSRQIPFPQLSLLIRTMGRYPAVDTKVWVTDEDGHKRVRAYNYFHNVLGKLVGSLPTKAPNTQTTMRRICHPPVSVRYHIPDSTHNMQPPLERASYNSLLHYALRHRLSPTMASQVYNHMTTIREPPLVAGHDTNNILMRSATLLRRADVTDKFLEIFKKEISGVWVPDKPVDSKSLKSPRHVRQIKNSPYPHVPSLPLKQILQDSHTLSAYFSLLIATGHSDIVVKLAHRLFPILTLSRNGQMASLHEDRWKESLRRATILGTHILGIILNAVNKHGSTKKADIFFRLVRSAERESRTLEIGGEIRTWQISTVIYTTMLQIYKTEFERFRRRTPGFRTVRYMVFKAGKLYHSWKYRTDGISKQRKPDARFYNALMEVMVEILPVRVRKKSVKEAEDHLEMVKERYAATGYVGDQTWRPLLAEIFNDMEENGYPIPVGFKHLYVGKRGDFDDDSVVIPEMDRRPFVFRKSPRLGGPYTLPVYRTRGLPLRRTRLRKRVSKLRSC